MQGTILRLSTVNTRRICINYIIYFPKLNIYVVLSLC